MSPPSVPATGSRAFENKIPLPISPESCKPILVLGLDETLVHHPRNNTGPTFPYSGDSFVLEVPDTSLDGNVKEYRFHERPYVHEFLIRVSYYYTVVVYTTAEQQYASRVLAYLDPEGQWISAALYQDSCTRTGTKWLKDLNRVCKDESRLVLVDNTQACSLQKHTPCLAVCQFENNHEDRELERLGRMLAEYADGDMRLLWKVWETYSLK